MKKLLAILTSLILTIALLTGCGNDQKKVVVGLDDQFPPMGFRDEKNNIVGFDVDMGREATKRMGVEVEFKPIDWKSKEAELKGKRVDMLWNGFTITEQRKEQVAFTKPYMSNTQAIVVLAGAPIKTKADLAGKVIGVQDGNSVVEEIVQAPIYKQIKELKKYPDNIAAFMDLKAGRTQAIVLDEVVARYYITKNPGYEVLEENFGFEEYGVGLRKDDKELLSKLQKALDEMKADGTSAKINQKWFGKNNQ